jgi:hypothetical protein
MNFSNVLKKHDYYDNKHEHDNTHYGNPKCRYIYKQINVFLD